MVKRSEKEGEINHTKTNGSTNDLGREALRGTPNPSPWAFALEVQSSSIYKKLLPPIISLELLQGFSECISFQTLKAQKSATSHLKKPTQRC